MIAPTQTQTRAAGDAVQATDKDSPTRRLTRLESAGKPVRLRLRFKGVSPDGIPYPMNPPDSTSIPSTHGDVLTAISDGMVALLKEFYGRGPTRAKSYYEDDLVVCVLRGGFSRVEQTLLDGGRGHAVIQQRMEFQEVMRDRFTEVIAQATGRPVIGFMSGNQQHPDMMCEVFILAPTDLLGEHEWGDASGGSSLTA
jgi:uncharacterized protein YbcI